MSFNRLIQILNDLVSEPFEIEEQEEANAILKQISGVSKTD